MTEWIDKNDEITLKKQADSAQDDSEPDDSEAENRDKIPIVYSKIKSEKVQKCK